MLLWFLFMMSMLTSLVAQSGSSSVQANSLITLDGTSFFTNTNNILSSLSVTTTSATDTVLLVVNLNVASNSALSQSSYTIYRDDNNLTPDKVMAKADFRDLTEVQSASFTYMDVPGSVGTFLYSVRGRTSAIISSGKAKRQLAALVIPYTVPTSKKTVDTLFTIGKNTFTDFGLSTSITPTSVTDRVLVSASFTVDPQEGTKFGAKFALFRNNAQVGTTTFQNIKMSAHSENRMFSMFFLDEPGSSAAQIYSIRGMKYSDDYTNFTLCDNDNRIAHLNTMVVPSMSSDSASATASLVVNSAVWTTVGLSATVTPPSLASQVLVTVNINYRADDTTSKGAFTIFRGTTNLGDSTTGLQVVQTWTDDINTVATLSFLDTPQSTSPVVYTAQAKSLVSATSFKVSHNDQIRHIAAIVTSPDITDCRSGSCKFSSDVLLSSTAVFQRLRLSTLFSITISLTAQTLAAGSEGLFELRDAVSGVPLLSITRTTNLNTRWTYNGATIVSSGFPLIAGSVSHTPNDVTTFTITIQSGTINIISSNQGTTLTTAITTADTTGRVYEMRLFNNIDIALAGTFANIGITGMNAFTTCRHSKFAS